MKYIKTTWGEILEIVKIEKDVCIGGFWYRPRHKKDSVHSDFVSKESDSIEDLCDFFAWKWEGKLMFEENKHTESFYECFFESKVSYGRESPIYGYSDFKPVAIYDGEWRLL